MPNDDGLFTQEEVNELMGKTRREVREKFSDYQDLKTKVEELTKGANEADSLRSELAALKAAQAERETIEKVAKATGLPAELLKAGQSEEELTKWAEAVKAHFAPKAPTMPTPGKLPPKDATPERVELANMLFSN